MPIERPTSVQPIPEHAKKVFSGILFDVYQWEQKMYDGSTRTFEKLKRPDTVVVFPVLDDGRIILTEELQPAKAASLGTISGRIDDGEDVMDAAKRELLEETGYEAKEYILWSAVHPTSKIEWVIYTFIAKGVQKVAEQHLDGGEKITLKPVTFDELVALGTDESFGENQCIPKFMGARLDPARMEELRKLFSPQR